MPTSMCDPGWYCTLGSSLAQPASPEGGKCVANQYCPQGSSAPMGCEPGQYCDVDMMDSPRGNCAAGYYCSSNSSTNQPTGTGGKGDNSTYYLAAVDSFFFSLKFTLLSLKKY